MKTNYRFLALSAAILSMFTACQREELEQNQKPEALTHSVTFVAGAPETKTTVDISDGETAKFKWTKADEGRFTVYENGVPATKVLAKLGIDGKMSMTATFSGDVPASPKYQALYNSEVSANQNIVKDSYAEVSDVMVSNVLDGTRNDNFVFSFKREVAFAKMTLKDLTSGAYVSSVTIESDKPIAGKYDLKTGTFVNTSNVITLDVLTDVANGNATVWFTTIPVEDATFTITAKTTNDLEAVAATYTKTFSKTITLTRGDVKGFGVAMTKDAPKIYGYQKITTVEDYTPGDYIIVAHVYKDGCPTKGDFAISNTLTLNSDKLPGQDVTNLIENDVIYASDGSSYKLTLSGDKDNIEISNGTNKLGWKSSTDLVLGRNNTKWSLSLNVGDGGTFGLLNNSTANQETKRALEFQSYTSSGTNKTKSLKFGAYSTKNFNNVDYTAIELYKYQEIAAPTPKYAITVSEVTGGTLSANPTSAKEGTEITLTETPDAGYKFENWDVKDAKGTAVEVVDNKFKMPASDVTVSGTFSKIDYNITKTTSDRGSFVAMKGDSTVETAQVGDEITLGATPKEGYEFISWTVVDSKGNSVEVRGNKFTMPASNVTVSATFNSTASYTVSFSVNGNVTTKSYKETEKIEFPDVPAQDGVKFMGWATSDFSGIVSSKPELVDVNRAVMGTNDITYYAVFGVIETAVFDPNDLSATPAVSDQSLTWKHTATGVTLKLSEGQLYTGTPKTFTVNVGNNFQISSDKNYIISEIETTLSESKYKINSVSSGATLSISGTTQTVKSDNLTVIKCNATSSNQIRATKITVTALTGYSTKIISLIAVAVSGTPTKTEYTVGETFDPKGLTVTGTYSNGDSAQISDGISWTCTPSTFDASGNRTVKVIATVKSIPSAEYNVNVTVNTIYNTLAATDKSINVNTNLDVKTLFTTNSNAEIKYTLVENPSDAGTLTGTTFSANAAGTYKVQASQAATTTHSAAEATATITVSASKTYSYIFESKSWTATLDGNSANWISGKDGNGYSNGGVQVTTGSTGANATSPIEFTNVSKIVVRYCTNSKAGQGTVTLKVGETTFGSQSISAPSSGGTTEKSFEISTNTPLSGKVNISVVCTTNSIYIIGIDITAK